MPAVTRRDALLMAAGLAAPTLAAAAAADPTALVRLSVLGDEAFAPTDAGDLIDADFDPAARVGRLGPLPAPALAPPGSAFRSYLDAEVRRRTPRLAAGPVVVMVHGFLADPREAVRPDAPRLTNNPHDFSYHFLPGPGPYWRHTASWPLGLGFAEHDGGAAGLAVGFGWNSTPDLLTGGLLSALAAARGKLSWADLIDLPVDLLELAATYPAIVAAAKGIPVPLSVDRVGQGVGRLDELLTAVEEPLARLGDRLPDLYREPYRRADQSAWVLANTLAAMAEVFPGRPLDLFCHSLGSRVVVQCLHRMALAAGGADGDGPRGVLARVGRVVIVGGAEYTRPARDMLAAVRAVRPRGPEFYNFLARRDRILGLLAQRFHPVGLDLRRVVGLSGLGADRPDPDWLDLQLDAGADGSHPLNAWLRPRGLSVSGADLTGVLNHWHYFSDERNMALFRAIVRDRAAWDIATLRRAGIPEAVPADAPSP